jgi:formylglycine-generating enzyme required for sulfatase activity
LYGQHDLAGSMAEWVMGGSLDEFAPGCTDCVGLSTGPIRFWKGGSWIDSIWPLQNASIVGGDRSFRLQFIGVRCARDVL